VYPGDYEHSNQVNQFRLASTGMCGLDNEQILASRGYAVLMPEIPQRRGTPMKDLVDGVRLAVNEVIELGIADSDRLGICGYSYGGYSTIAVITQTTRFKAAIMGAGQGDLVSHYLAFNPDTGSDGVSWAEGGQGLMGGSPWQFPDRYREKSPLTYLDRVRTPLLIVHGEDDGAVKVKLSDQIFVGLRRLGREVEYRRYANEGHSLARRENLADYWNAVVRWFDTYVKGIRTPSDQP
jgi:dipeptidyl aminopeptidase/acylaminoacyl peptidase